MDLRALSDRDNFDRPFDPSSQIDPGGLLDAFARIHALGLAHLASHANLAGRGDVITRGQSGQAPQLPPEPMPRGLPSLLVAASPPTLLADAAGGTPDAMRPDTSRVEDRTQRRYASGIADQAKGGTANPRPPQLARGITDCNTAHLFCLGTLKDLRSQDKCNKLKALCENGVPGIFAPGVGGRLGG